MRAYNPALLYSEVSSIAMYIDATSPQSSHPRPLIDLQARVDEDALAATSDGAVAAYNDSTVPPDPVNVTDLGAGYGGIGSAISYYDRQPIESWPDSDWSGASSTLSFAWRGWDDPESSLHGVEYSVIELREQEGYDILNADPAVADASSAPVLLSAEAARSYLQYLGSDDGGLGAARLLRSASRWLQVEGMTDEEYQAAVAAGDLAAPPIDTWDKTNPSLTFNDDFIVSGAGITPKALSVQIPSYEEVYTALADVVSLPLQSALRGQLANPWVFWGGAPLTSFLASQTPGGSGNITVGGLALKPGRQYAIALRAYSGSSQFTQMLSDGVRADIPRAVPCFGRIHIGPASKRADPPELMGVASGTLTGLPRPTPQPQDPNAASSLLGSGADLAVQFTPYAARLTLSLLHFADPYVQRPSALKRLYVCPDVDGYGSDYNSNYTSPGDTPLAPQNSRYKLAIAPVETYAIRLELMSAAPGTTDGSSATSAPGRLLSVRARSLQATDASSSLPSSGDVPLHPSGRSFLPGSDACCRPGAYDKYFAGSIASDVEVRLPLIAGSSGASIAVVAPVASSSEQVPVSTTIATPSYALVGSTGFATLIPLHHISGAYAHIDLIRLGAADPSRHTSATAVVAASKVPSGFTAPENVAPSNTDIRRPAFAVAGPRGVALFEVHMRSDATINTSLCTPPACYFGTDVDDDRRLARTETVYPVASIPLDPDAFDPASSSGFARAVTVHNVTVAIAGPSSSTLRAAVAERNPSASDLLVDAFAVQVCENAPSVLRYLRDLSAPSQPGPYDWRSLSCACVTPPSDPSHAETGIDGLQVPYLISVEQGSFGTSLSLGPSLLAVGASLSSANLYSTASDYATTLDAVLLYRPSLTSDDLAGAAAATNISAGLSDLMTSILIDAAASSAPSVFPRILVDPLVVGAASDPAKTFVPSSSFGRSVDVDASGSVLLVGAPDASYGQGMVYAYTLTDGAPQLACYFKGGLPGYSKLGQSVAALCVRGSKYEDEAPDGTLGLAAVSFHGLATFANGSAYETAATAMLAVRSLPAAQAYGVPQYNLYSSASDNASPELEALGIPRCPLIAYIGAGEARLDVKLQSGLQDASDVNATAGAEALMALVAQGAFTSSVTPVVAAGGSHVMMADSAALRPGTVASDDDGSAAPSTGLMWATVFCARGSARTKSGSYARLPFLCQSCSAGEDSYGGLSAACSSCSTVDASSGSIADTATCFGRVDSAGLATDVLLELTDDTVDLQHGATYKVHLRGITASGLWREIPGPITVVDTTPPVPTAATAGGSGINDGPYVDDINTCTGDCNTDLAYTSDLSSYSLWHGGFAEDVSGIDYYMVGVSSLPCDGLLWRPCSVESVVVSFSENVTRELSDCSQLEIDFRRSIASELGLADWRLAGTADYPIPFDLDDPFDIAPLENVGLDRMHEWHDLTNLHTGSYVFGCVIAYNKAGARTAVSSTGLVYDTTPPVVVAGSVSDGLAGADFDQQGENTRS